MLRAFAAFTDTTLGAITAALRLKGSAGCSESEERHHTSVQGAVKLYHKTPTYKT